MNPPSAALLEAARYAVLRRLVPALRHKLMSELHPIAMTADLAARRLQAAQPDLASLRDGSAKIKAQTQAAAASCAAVMVWLAPQPAIVTPLATAVRECLALLGAELGMRGFDIEETLEAGAAVVSQSALRSVLVASLLALTDALPQPADIELTATQGASCVDLRIRARAAERIADMPGTQEYRAIRWDDVEALASAEGVALFREPGGALLRYPLFSPARGAD